MEEEINFEELNKRINETGKKAVLEITTPKN